MVIEDGLPALYRELKREDADRLSWLLPADGSLYICGGAAVGSVRKASKRKVLVSKIAYAFERRMNKNILHCRHLFWPQHPLKYAHGLSSSLSKSINPSGEDFLTAR